MSEDNKDIKPEETMDKLMDRRKIIKVQEFKPSYSGKWESSGNGNVYGDFELWQKNNPEMKIISTNIVEKTPAYTTPAQPSMTVPESRTIMYVTYEDYVNI